jgi:hypothetical protein
LLFSNSLRFLVLILTLHLNFLGFLLAGEVGDPFGGGCSEEEGSLLCDSVSA